MAGGKQLDLRNIGPETEKWLLRVGITSKEQLKKLGAHASYDLLLEAGHERNRNLYYALLGAIEDLDWRIVADREKHLEETQADCDE